jgi:flagellar P-ring protein precursor FlgI
VRLKDIVDVQGVRENQLVGYGLVVGLNGTGDSLGSSKYTQESFISMLERMGVNVRDGNPAQTISSKNIAAVMVTATLHPFASQGARIDLNISALGDARDLRGGTLLVTPLLGADGEVYAVAQGPVSVNAIQARGNVAAKGEGAQASVSRGVPTSGHIANGATVEREIPFTLNTLKNVRLSLRNPDFTTARRVANVINDFLKLSIASARDPSNVEIRIPDVYKNRVIDLITDIEHLQVTPDQAARIVINDRDGVIVMSDRVRLSRVAVTHGNITIRIDNNALVSQPNPFTQVQQATVVNEAEIDITEEKGKFGIIEPSASLDDLVAGLNAMGATPRDIISILQNIKAAGALQADIVVR